MWHKDFEDYPDGQPLKREKVEAGKGIIGCEMHEIAGYQEELHRPAPRRKGVIALFLAYIFGDK